VLHGGSTLTCTAYTPARPAAAGVTLLARGEALAASMSDCLITYLKATRNIEVWLRTRVADGHGQARLEALTLQDIRTGPREQAPPRPCS
jgi:thioredoxin reductase (NADPH)